MSLDHLKKEWFWQHRHTPASTVNSLSFSASLRCVHCSSVPLHIHLQIIAINLHLLLNKPRVEIHESILYFTDSYQLLLSIIYSTLLLDKNSYIFFGVSHYSTVKTNQTRGAIDCVLNSKCLLKGFSQSSVLMTKKS